MVYLYMLISFFIIAHVDLCMIICKQVYIHIYIYIE